MTGPDVTAPRPRPAPSNVEQARGWDGGSGTLWADNADRFDEGVAAHHGPFLSAAAIGPAERVLDVGCGTGRATLDAARRAPRGAALGVDLSARMLERARRRSVHEGLANVSFVQADAQEHPFEPASFDVVVSRHGTMFFGEPVTAFANLARALRPGGRLVLLTWQPYERQEWLRTFRTLLAAGRSLADPGGGGGPGPFSLSDPARVRSVLTDAGFADVHLAGLVAPMCFGPDPDDASHFVGGQFAELLHGLDPAARARALSALRGDMAGHRTDRGVRYSSAAWLVEARRPGRSG